MSNKLVLFKLVVLGSGGVGKTALTIQFCLNHFVETYDPTIEDSYRKQVVIDNQQCMLEILDTAGQEEYTALRDQWIRDGEGFLLIYSVTSRTSFNQIPRFFKQINRVKEVVGHRTNAARGLPNGPQYSGPSPIVLVGNKCDRVTEREVSTQEGAQMARELGCEFIEASAKNNLFVDRAFFDLARKLRRQRIDPEQAKKAAANFSENEKFGAKGSGKGGIKARYRRREAAKKMCVIL